MTDFHAVMNLIRPLSLCMTHLSASARTQILMVLLTHEVCMCPASEREAAMAGIMRKLPAVLEATEAGMRLALVANARGGV